MRLIFLIKDQWDSCAFCSFVLIKWQNKIYKCKGIYIYIYNLHIYYVKGMNTLWSRGCVSYSKPTIFDRELGSKL